MTILEVSAPSRSWLSRHWRERPELSLFATILAIGFALRLWFAGPHSLGPGEIATIMSARLGAGSSDANPLVSRLIQLWWNCGLGENAYTWRLLPILLSMGVVVAVYWLGRNLFGDHVALAASALVAVNPSLILQGGQVLPHSMGVGVVVWAIALMLVAWKRKQFEYWLFYAAVAVAAIFSDAGSVPVLVGFNAILLIVLRGPAQVSAWCGANLFVAAVSFLHVRNLVRAIDAAESSTPVVAAQRLFDQLVAFPTSAPPAAGYLAVMAAVVAILAVVGVIVGRKTLGRELIVILLGSLFALCAVFVLQCVGSSNSMPTVLVVGITLLLCVATCVRAVTASWLGTMGTAVLSAGFVVAVPLAIATAPWREPGFGLERRGAYATAVRQLESFVREVDVILSADPALLTAINYESNGSLTTVVAFPDAAETLEAFAGLFDDLYVAEGVVELQELEPAVRGANRVWLVYSADATVERRRFAGRILAWCDTHLFETEHLVYPEVELFCFEPRVNGRWTRRTAILADDGGMQRRVYNNGSEIRYAATAPGSYTVGGDSGAISRYSLAFTSPQVGADVVLVGTVGDGPTQAIALRNDSSAPCEATVRIASTNQLVPISSFVEQDPNSPVWAFNQAMHPISIVDATYAATLDSNQAEGLLLGFTDLTAGQYHVYCYQLGRLEGEETPAAYLRMGVGASGVFSVTTPSVLPENPWTWHTAGWFELPLDDGRVNISIVAGLANGVASGAVEVGGLAFVAAQPNKTPNELLDASFQTRTISLGANESKVVLVAVDAVSRRLDVWMDVAGSKSGTRHIFNARD